MSTGLDQCLIERWRDTAGLSALIPVKLVGTEIIQTNETLDADEDQDGHFDDCVVLKITTDPHWRTNSRRGWKSEVRVCVESIDYDRGKTAAQLCETLWDSTTYTGSETSITFSRSKGIASEQDATSGIWETAVTFEIHHTGV